MRPPAWLDVEVPGGTLRVARWGPAPGGGAPVVVAAHGITASHVGWSQVAELVAGEVTLLAPDLRGRGDSGGLPGPYGIAVHGDDLVAVLDAVGVERAVFAGHSMGAFVVATAAVRHPDRVERVVLVDGGPPLAAEPAPDADVEQVLGAIIGPSLERLRRRFATPGEYRAFWRSHPALADLPAAVVDAYADHDLTGEPGAYRSKVSLDAVRADAADTLRDPVVLTAVERLEVPAVLLYAERGMLDQPAGLYAADVGEALARPGLQVRLVPGANHFTITLGEAGARAVAATLTGPQAAGPR